MTIHDLSSSSLISSQVSHLNNIVMPDPSTDDDESSEEEAEAEEEDEAED